MIPIVENFLVYLVNRAKRKDQRPIDKVSQFMLQQPSRVSLDWLADQACLSTKQFYRQFMEREGVSPKLYARIARFDQSVKLKNTSPQKDWLSNHAELNCILFLLINWLKQMLYSWPNVRIMAKIAFFKRPHDP
jgi:AraC-like DNA-binding protein